MKSLGLIPDENVFFAASLTNIMIHIPIPSRGVGWSIAKSVVVLLKCISSEWQMEVGAQTFFRQKK